MTNQENNYPIKQILKTLRLEKPKASCSPFVFFAKDKRKEVTESLKNQINEGNKEKMFQQVSAILGQMWKNVSPEEREYYEECSLYDKCRFKEEKRIYRQQFFKRLSEALQDGSIQPNQIDISIIPPIKHPRSAFMFFSRHIRPLLKVHGECDKPQAIGKPLSTMWNSLNESQRRPFVQLNIEDNERTQEDRLQSQEITAFK
ncbi:HMG box family protein [Trichomonas vaginalis G3]|uniref:HMG box family protein n=1 Tax=Trichomonas vaginalis (strain ATCC PRA-98 / G3) TaxID=412133 RepID=A2DDM7_TRIV3|nr:high mobility group protein [Trichomonas vaginalis G3]EAY21403.1 HMG box family protein [Trichomonas vaginalis G3]KAI5490616.1 high mobility group protein [Trichomonas vaginalis G3]|eukprot:XP_001582389.1 HMG box family protein [Trichomonas vaginalis G3]